jgi:hypothetical protein
VRLKVVWPCHFSSTVVCHQVWPSHFYVKTTYCIFFIYMAAPFANLCVSSMAEPFLCGNYLLCLSLFMAAPLANLYSLNMAEPFVISVLKGDMAAPFFPHFDMSANMAEPFQCKNLLTASLAIHGCVSYQICAFQAWPSHFCANKKKKPSCGGRAVHLPMSRTTAASG